MTDRGVWGDGRVVVASDVRLFRGAEGQWWSTHPTLSLESLGRYLDMGAPVVLVAREATGAGQPVHVLTHPRLSFHTVGADDKGTNLVRRAAAMARAVLRVPLRRGDLAIIRVPEVVSLFVGFLALTRRARVVSNVVAEPSAISGNLPRLLGVADRLYRMVARALVWRSSATVYVTQRILQEEMPPAPGSPTLSASNVRLADSDFLVPARDFGPWSGEHPLRIVAVGSMEAMGKGYDVLIEAVGLLRKDGLSVELELIGDGALRTQLEHLVTQVGASSHVRFHGYLSQREDLTRVLDQCHVFAMPSRNEGLPRAMIEAMARGLCVIGSRVGGIVELASPECLFEPNDADSLAECVRRLYFRPRLAAEQAAQGRERAQIIKADADPTRVTRFLLSIVGADD